MAGLRFHSNDYLRAGEKFHFSRTALAETPPRRLHRQDYYEVFWIQNGAALHVVNGARQVLAEGDLFFIRPDDLHGFQARATTTLLVNVLVLPETVAALAADYPELDGRFFWDRSEIPERHPHTSRQLAELSRAALRLEAAPRTDLALAAFLLPLLAERATATLPLPRDVPAWFRAACEAARDPEVFRDGAAGFVRAAGRTHAHVSRTAMAVLGQTPSQYVNACRMDHAARQLAGTPETLTDIALDCGIENMSHFHKLFRAHTGFTPKAYRKRFQREIVQPA